jgi:hypothetical protein
MIYLHLQSHNSNMSFSFPESARETTLGKYIAYKKEIEPGKPQSLCDYEEAAYDVQMLDALPLKEITEAWTVYYISFISFWTGIPQDALALTAVQEVAELYKLILQSVAAFEQQPGQTSFRHLGQEYYYPAHSVNAITLEEEYLRSAKVIEVIEALQFEEQYSKLKEGYWEALPYIIAILCRRDKEQLPLDGQAREAFMADRAALFDTLPLQDALNFAFFLPALKLSAAGDGSPYLTLRQKGCPLLQERNTAASTGGTYAWKALPGAAFLLRRGLRKCKALWRQMFTKPLTG